jgi:hypothetical protein
MPAKLTSFTAAAFTIFAVAGCGSTEVVRTTTVIAPTRPVAHAATHKRARAHRPNRTPAATAPVSPAPAGACGLGRCPETVPNQPANVTPTTCNTGGKAPEVNESEAEVCQRQKAEDEGAPEREAESLAEERKNDRESGMTAAKQREEQARDTPKSCDQACERKLERETEGR